VSYSRGVMGNGMVCSLSEARKKNQGGWLSHSARCDHAHGEFPAKDKDDTFMVIQRTSISSSLGPRRC
jgi:tRNA-binding EMAP/Myf-like protein